MCEDELQLRFQTNCRTDLSIGSKDKCAGGGTSGGDAIRVAGVSLRAFGAGALAKLQLALHGNFVRKLHRQSGSCPAIRPRRPGRNLGQLLVKPRRSAEAEFSKIANPKAPLIRENVTQ